MNYTGSIGTASRVFTDNQSIAAMYLLEITDRDAPCFYRFHGVGVVSLLDVPGVPPAKKSYPEAQWSLSAFTIDADKIRPTTENLRIWQRVTPDDVDLHFHGLDREQCAELVKVVATLCADGDVPIEPARVLNAEAIWKTIVRRTIDHLAQGIVSVPRRPQAVM
ncbi:MAG TPA: hypothetical protein VGJ64_02330 [Gemmatimonadaceae bacterium]